jgi:hypothetical protein
MRNIFLLCLGLFLLTATAALAVKPESQQKVDYEAELQAEIEPKKAAEADLQNQIDNIQPSAAASVMYLKIEPPNAPPTCPEHWTEAGLSTISSGGGSFNTVRTCYNMDNSCAAMYLKIESPNTPPTCPEHWIEAGLSTISSGSGSLNIVRTCFYCAK